MKNCAQVSLTANLVDWCLYFDSTCFWNKFINKL